MQDLINKIVAASQLADDGSVNAVVEVTLKFVVTIGLEKSEIESLDEQALRDALAAQVNEMIGMSSNIGDAIEINGLLETRDGYTDEILAVGE
ncbi:hypothetical protein [Dechloromonas sp. ZS-1]|uniref:hypothetical protein n=1 Tax=Dechloromonas sp. ZS-1 TaxID=3138067 RepID=UPI0031FBF384